MANKRKKVRDIYGNWVWEDDEEEQDDHQKEDSERPPTDHQHDNDDSMKPEWRDYVSIIIAAFETVLLPMVILIVILFVLAVVFAHIAL